MRSRLFRAAAAGAGLLAASAASTQSVNYAELERTFGEPVTTSVNGKPQRASDAASSLLIITRDDIRRSPARDIPDLLKIYAGIDATRWAAGQTELSVRGGVQVYNPRLLVLVNGRQVYLDHYGMTNWSILGVQIEEIQQIEVVKGPGSALFGFNAAAGVVNIITVNPLNSRTAAAALELGSAGTVRASATAAVPLDDRIGVRLSAGYEEYDELDGVVVATLGPSATRRDAVRREAAGDLHLRLDAATEAVIGFTHSENDRIEYSPTLQATEGRYDTSSLSARLSHETDWGALSATLYRNELDARYRLDLAGRKLAFDNDTLVAALNGLARFGAGDVFRLGVEYRRNRITATPGYPGATRYDVVAGSAMWERKLTDRATLTLAGRLDHLMLEQQGPIDAPMIYTAKDFDRELTEWSANAALLYTLDASSSVRVAVGRGNQAPSLLNFGFRFVVRAPELPFPIVPAGDPATKAAHVSSAEIGFRKAFAAAADLEITAFYTRTTDAIAFPANSSPPRATPPAVPYVLITGGNVGAFETYGIEASIDGRIGRDWTWLLNYSWVETDEAIAGAGRGRFRQPLAFAAQTPKHKANAQLSYRAGPWLATVQGRYTSAAAQLVDGFGGFWPIAVDDALACDAKLAFALTDRLELSVAGENLTDAAGATGAAARGERRVRAGLRVGL